MIFEKFSRISKFTGQVTFRKLDLLLKTTPISQKISNPQYTCKNQFASYTYNQVRYLNAFSGSRCTQLDIKHVPIKNQFYEQLFGGNKFLETSEDYVDCVPRPMKFDESLVVDNLEELLNKSWISMSNSEIIENFELLSHYSYKHQELIHDPKFSGVLEVIKSRCVDFSDSDIRHIFKCLQLWNTDKHQEVYTDFWKALETELLKRFSSWTIDEVLFTSHLYYKLRISRSSEFTFHSLKKLGRKPQNMNRTQLVHFTFLMKMNRRLPVNVYNIEYYVEQQADKLSALELAIFTIALSQYEIPIRSPAFIGKILDKLIEEKDTIDELSLNSLVNAIRIHQTTTDRFLILLENFEKICSSYSLNTLINIAHIQKKTLMHNKSLISKILERCEAEIKNLNIKQIDKLLLSLMTLGYDPKTTPFVSLAIHELLEPSRADELEKFPKSLVCIVHSILLMNHYSKDLEELCSKILDPHFVQEFCHGDYYYLNREYLEISYCLEIDHPEYRGPKLESEAVDFLCKSFGSFKNQKTIRRSEKDTPEGKILTKIGESFKKLANSDSAFYRESVLPHFHKAYGIVCYNPETKEFGSPKDKLQYIPWNLPKYAPVDNQKWFAVIAVSISQIINNTKKPVGKVFMQMRQLEKIGYEPVVIPYYEWNSLENDAEKEKYILDFLQRQYLFASSQR